MVPHCGFDLHFSDKEWCQASFHVFVSHLYVFSGELTDTFIRPLPVEKMATHSSILAWRIPGIEGPGGLQSMGLQSWTGLKWLSMQHARLSSGGCWGGGWDGADADTFSHGGPSISGGSLTDPPHRTPLSWSGPQLWLSLSTRSRVPAPAMIATCAFHLFLADHALQWDPFQDNPSHSFLS